MKLFSAETLDRGVVCTSAWISFIKRVNPSYRDGYSIRIVIPWYKLDWHVDPCRDERKWCRQYPEVFIFLKGFIGQRVFFGWQRADDLEMWT